MKAGEHWQTRIHTDFSMMVPSGNYNFRVVKILGISDEEVTFTPIKYTAPEPIELTWKRSMFVNNFEKIHKLEN